jgi:hypothetical protein
MPRYTLSNINRARDFINEVYKNIKLKEELTEGWVNPSTQELKNSLTEFTEFFIVDFHNESQVNSWNRYLEYSHITKQEAVLLILGFNPSPLKSHLLEKELLIHEESESTIGGYIYTYVKEFEEIDRYFKDDDFTTNKFIAWAKTRMKYITKFSYSTTAKQKVIDTLKKNLEDFDWKDMDKHTYSLSFLSKSHSITKNIVKITDGNIEKEYNAKSISNFIKEIYHNLSPKVQSHINWQPKTFKNK